jgi:hypothetical protein
MSSAIAFLSVIAAALIFMLVGTNPNLNGWIKAGIIVPIVFIVVYLLARIPPAAARKGESRLVKVFEKTHP